MSTPEQPTVIEFIDTTFAGACGVLSSLLDNTEDWDDLAMLPETFQALRAMPVEYQTAVAAPIIANAFKTLGVDVLTEWDRQERMAQFDPVIASAVRDGFAMTVQALNNQANLTPSTGGVKRAAPSRLIT